MRNPQDHNQAITNAIGIASLPINSPVRSQFFHWLENSADDIEFPQGWKLETLAATGLSKIEKIQKIEYRADFIQHSMVVLGFACIALAMLVALLAVLDIVGISRPFLFGLPIAAIGCSMIWAFNIFGALPQLNTSKRPDLLLCEAERNIVWHIGEYAPLS
jgi:predicted RND superfamily exporter protein